MKIWVDADSCPREIREIIIKAALRNNLSVDFVANRSMTLPLSATVKLIVVGSGLDVADDYIVEHSDPYDLVVADDVPLADRLVKKKVAVVSRRGEVFDENNIGDKLASRDLMTSLRSIGLQTPNSASFSAADKKRFADRFNRELQKCLANIALFPSFE